jgi:SAM-dependent methyltransferase
MEPAVDPEILDWYSSVVDEESRLERTASGRLEARRTKEIIGRFLRKEPMRVLDVGGGAGVYAGWLADLGHVVHLVDPVPRHVSRATALPGVTGALGDARALAEKDSSVDLCLLLGPLYHLADRDERVRCLAEGARVTRSGGAMVASAIGRYNALTEFVLEAAFTGSLVDALARFMSTGEIPAGIGGFPIRHGHTADELASEASAAGWRDVHVLTVEGPAGHAVDLVDPAIADQVEEQAAAVAELVEDDPRMVDTAAHLIVVGRPG